MADLSGELKENTEEEELKSFSVLTWIVVEAVDSDSAMFEVERVLDNCGEFLGYETTHVFGEEE